MIHQDGIHGVYSTSTVHFPCKYAVHLTSLNLGQNLRLLLNKISANSCRWTDCVTSINFCARRLNCFPSFRPGFQGWRRNDEAKLPTLTNLLQNLLPLI